MPVIARRHQHAREALARDLAAVLTEHGCDADTAQELPPGGWAMAVSIVSERRGRPVEMPSSATTSLVLFILRQREDTTDPFEGLPS